MPSINQNAKFQRKRVKTIPDIYRFLIPEDGSKGLRMNFEKRQLCSVGTAKNTGSNTTKGRGV